MSYILLFSLAGLLGLVSAVLWILLIVKVFKHAGVGLGILSIFCGPFTYIWGWVKSGELKLVKLMVWLTLLTVGAFAFYVAGGAAYISSPEGQKLMQQSQQGLQQPVEGTLPAPQN